MQDEEEALATLTFNTSASKEMFAEEKAKGLKLRIERGVVTFRSVQRGGDDVVAIERRPRGVRVELDRSQLPKRLMQRLFRAGLTQEQPYFLIEPVSRGWYGIQHYPFDHPPQRQAIMVVSEFDPPPVPIDLQSWHRFRRAISTQRPIDQEQWQAVFRMVLSAVRLVARPQRGGRVSAERQAAGRLLKIVEDNESLLMGWAQQEPEAAADVRDMLMQVIGREPEEPGVVPIPAPQPDMPEDSAEDRPSRRGGRPRRPFPLASVETLDDESQTEPGPRQTRRRRTWPKIPPLDAEGEEPEDLPPPARPVMVAEDDVPPEAAETASESETEASEPVSETAWDDPTVTETEGDTAPVAAGNEPVEIETFAEAAESEPVAAETDEGEEQDETVDETELAAAEETGAEAAGADETEATGADAAEGESVPDETGTPDQGESDPDAGTGPKEVASAEGEGEPEPEEPEREIDLDKVFARFVDQVRSEGDEPGVSKPEHTEENKKKPPGMGDQPDVD